MSFSLELFYLHETYQPEAVWHFPKISLSLRGLLRQDFYRNACAPSCTNSWHNFGVSYIKKNFPVICLWDNDSQVMIAFLNILVIYGAPFPLITLRLTSAWLFNTFKSTFQTLRFRHGITLKGVSGEFERLRKRWLLLVRDDLVHNEFYEALPSKSLHFRGKSCSGGKHSKVRIISFVAIELKIKHLWMEHFPRNGFASLIVNSNCKEETLQW